MDSNLKIIISQTDYCEEKAQEKLNEFEHDVMAVLREFHQIKPKEEQVCKTSNQERLRLFRNTLDEANKNYRFKKEEEEKLQGN